MQVLKIDDKLLSVDGKLVSASSLVDVEVSNTRSSSAITYWYTTAQDPANPTLSMTMVNKDQRAVLYNIPVGSTIYQVVGGALVNGKTDSAGVKQQRITAGSTTLYVFIVTEGDKHYIVY